MNSVEPGVDVSSSPPNEKASRAQVNTSPEPIAVLLGDEAHHVDPIVEARVLKKIDTFLMPAMLIGMDFRYHHNAGLLAANSRRLWLSLLRQGIEHIPRRQRIADC